MLKNDAIAVERADRGALNEALALLEAQFAEHHIAVDPARLSAAVSALCDGSDRGVLLLARRGGAAVAVAALTFTWSLEHGGRVAWLEELYVVPERRCDGIGTELVEQALAVAREAGCRGRRSGGCEGASSCRASVPACRLRSPRSSPLGSSSG